VSGTVTIAVGDGYSGRVGSDVAAVVAVESGIGELTRSDAGPRTAEQAHRAAASVADAAVRRMTAAGEYNPPGTTCTAVQVSGGRITASGVGDTHAVYVTADGSGVESFAGARHARFGEDSPDSTPHFRERVVNEAGVIVVATDGFYHGVDTAALRRIVRENGIDRLDRLVAALLRELHANRGGWDDHTVVVTRVQPEEGARRAAPLGMLPTLGPAAGAPGGGIFGDIAPHAVQMGTVAVAAGLVAVLLTRPLVRAFRRLRTTDGPGCAGSADDRKETENADVRLEP